jgi:hypothetical protein
MGALNAMRMMQPIAILVFLLVSLIGTFAQTPKTKPLVCDHPNSCAHLNCEKTCVDVWEDGVCQGGYCSQGMVAQSTKKFDLHLQNVSPVQAQKIREMLEKGE